MAKKMRNRVLRFFLRHTAKTVPPAENMDRQLLYRLLLTSQRFMNQILLPFGHEWIRLFLRQHDVIFDCSVFGLIDCGQRFDFMYALNLIRVFRPKVVEVVIIGRNLRFNQLRQFLIKLKTVVPLFNTTHHKNLTRSVQPHQRVLLETVGDQLSRVEVFENQLPYLQRSKILLEKCVIHCKSSLGFGQLALVLKTKCKVLVGRYRFSEFYECKDCSAQPYIQELQLINDDAAWHIFCQPDSFTFFDLLHAKLPNLKRLIMGMSERILLRDGQHWTLNCVDDLVMQLVNFNRHQFLNKNYDLREHCRSQIQNVHRRAKQMDIKLFLCYDTQGMYSIYETPKLYPIEASIENGDKTEQ